MTLKTYKKRGEKTGIELHIAAWVTWHSKAEKLEFYNDDESKSTSTARST